MDVRVDACVLQWLDAFNTKRAYMDFARLMTRLSKFEELDDLRDASRKCKGNLGIFRHESIEVVWEYDDVIWVDAVRQSM